MKKINLVYFEKKIDQSFIDNVLTNSENVSIFIKKDGELFSNSKFSDSQKLEINMKCISLDQNFSNKLIELIHLVHEIIPSIKTSDLAESQDYSLQHKGKIEAVVSSLVNKFSYENKGLLEFVSLLLIRIARAHAWHNGNKRTAIVSVSKLLSIFGYYIKWSNNNEHYISEWEEFMYKISGKNDEEDKKLQNEEKLLIFVKSKLQQSIWIDIRKISIV